MIEKHGDFREGESRSDLDFTKIATHTNGFLVGTKKELEAYIATHPEETKKISDVKDNQKDK